MSACPQEVISDLQSDLRDLLTFEQIRRLRFALKGRRIALCYGAGVDSTAMIAALMAAGIVPDVITFADTGGEKQLTMDHLDRMDALLARLGWPKITRVRHHTLASTGYTTLQGNCLKNETLPSLAFGMKSCSIKWKQVPQDQYLMGVERGPNKCDPHPLWLECYERVEKVWVAKGERIVKLIGYDAGGADKRRSKNLATTDGNFDFIYPLQILGWTRVDCVRAITEAFGAEYVPVKSACYFCPASKKWELYWLAANEPDKFEHALLIERTALVGKHSRYDELHFGASWEDMVRNAESFPSSNTSVGLGRSFAWNQWARVNGVVDEEFKVRRELTAEFAARAAAMLESDNALDRRSCHA